MSESEAQTSKACASCKRTEEANGSALPNCAACHAAFYCNKDCQRSDWKTHKKDCTYKPRPKPQPAKNSHRSGITPKSMFGVTTKTALEAAPEEHAFKMLIDSFRLRVEDEYTFRGDVHEDSALGAGDPAAGFRRYLRQAETREDVLPAWWSAEKREACVAFGCRRGHFWFLGNAVEKSDIQERYGDGAMPMQLRMVGEEIVGSYVMAVGSAGLE